MVQDWLKNHRNEIFVSIITALIVASLGKMWRWLTTTGVSVGGSIIVKMRDLVYYEAGRQNYNSLTDPLFVSAATIVIVICARTWVKIQKEKKTVAYLLKAESALNEVDTIDKETESEKKQNEKLTEAKRALSKAKRMSGAEKKSENNLAGTKKKMRLGLWSLGLLIIFYFFYFFIIYIVPAGIWHGFERDITQITPYVEEHEVQRLRSDWVSMRTEDDYKEIYDYISSVKSDNNLAE